MQYIKRSLVMIILAIAVTVLAACNGGEKAEKVEPAHVEEIPGSEFNRVVLTEKAAERLGIETASVEEGEMFDTRTIEGEVTDPGEGVVRVALNKGMLERVDTSQPAEVLLDDDDEDEEEGWLAELFEPDDADEGDEDDDDEDELFFTLADAQQSLAEGQSVFVKLPMAAGASRGLVVPYSAVIYGLHGETWAYTNPEPQTFIRQPITVDYIEGGQAFLADGPPAGSKVVVVGAQMLYGTDTGVGK
ncbi:MAG: hypothetical protein GWP61_11240 [Chloroflexi bacterium]|nr:hypothetical protein [Chloroflexota bacterium]